MVNVSVEYYNKEEEELFRSYSNASEISSLAGRQQRISKNELMAYMMFTEQKDYEGFRTYQELQAKIQNRLGDIDAYFSFNEGNLTVRFTGNQMDKNLIERFGVGIGLSIINKLHNLTEADWKRIPEIAGRYGQPTFDFDIEIASDGIRYIQVENKGSAVENNDNKLSTISNHYASIKGKKEKVRTENTSNDNIFYGTIGVVDNQPGNTAKLLLVDPFAINIDYDPYKYRLLARLKFYLDEFKNIGVNNKMISALEKRINELAETSDVSEFDNKQIDYKYLRSFHLFIKQSMFAAVDTNEAFGKFFIVEKEEGIFPFILAFPKSLLKLIVFQRFEEILNYKYYQEILKSKVNVLLRVYPDDEIEDVYIEKLGFVFNERKKYFEASYYSSLSYSSSGRIFGELQNETSTK